MLLLQRSPCGERLRIATAAKCDAIQILRGAPSIPWKETEVFSTSTAQASVFLFEARYQPGARPRNRRLEISSIYRRTRHGVVVAVSCDVMRCRPLAAYRVRSLTLTHDAVSLPPRQRVRFRVRMFSIGAVIIGAFGTCVFYRWLKVRRRRLHE